ncbi:MAG TPA: hypothetical protein VIE65_04200 [Methylobacter sp.]|jgi:hypothetical protein
MTTVILFASLLAAWAIIDHEAGESPNKVGWQCANVLLLVAMLAACVSILDISL